MGLWTQFISLVLYFFFIVFPIAFPIFITIRHYSKDKEALTYTPKIKGIEYTLMGFLGAFLFTPFRISSAKFGIAANLFRPEPG